MVDVARTGYARRKILRDHVAQYDSQKRASSGTNVLGAKKSRYRYEF